MANNTKKKTAWWSLRLPSYYDKTIFLSMLFLLAFGTVMILSVNAKDAVNDSMAVYKTLLKQLAFFLVGYVGHVILARNFTLKIGKRYSFAVTVFILILCLSCLFFEHDYGISAWIPINLGPFTFTIQPSEFLKLAMIVYISSYLGSLSHKINYSQNDVLMVPLMILLFTSVVILKQDDFGALAIIAIITGIICLLTTHPVLDVFRKTIRAAVAVCVFFVWFLMFSPIGISVLKAIGDPNSYQIKRFEVARNPFSDYLASGWQIVSGLVAIHKGGWQGVGLGNSTYKYGYVPTALTDSILPIIIEELGVAGFIVIALAYFLILWKLFSYAWKIQNVTARMILVGIATYFFIHFVLNVGGVTGLIPMTGVPLLFISYGGSSTLNAMMSLGVAQSIICKIRRGEIV